MPIHPEVAALIAERQRLGISQAALARAAKINRVTMWRLETGQFLPSLRTLDRLRAALREFAASAAPAA